VSNGAEGKGQLSREQVYAAIEDERAYQDARWGGPSHDAFKSTGDFLVYMQDYMRRAVEAYTTNVGDLAALHMIRKVVALGVAAMEFNGAPRRGFLPEHLMPLVVICKTVGKA
jgi:hypothetical protein